MHVAMIGPHLDAQGGIASVARALIDEIDGDDVHVEFIASVTTAPVARKVRFMAAAQARFVARLARGWRPDLFHIHLSYFASFYRKLVWFREALLTGRPVVVHVHAPDLDRFFDAARLHREAMGWMFRRAARVLVLSEAMARTIRRRLGVREGVEVLYNPVDLDALCSPERPATDSPTVLFLGEVGERKGAWDLVAALPAVVERVPGARVRFGGNGDLDRLRAEVTRLGMADRVDILGWISGEEKLSALAGSDVLCLPSYHEGLPMSVLEAMAAGLPVVSTPIAGIPEAVVEGETGFLVPPGDRAALADRLARLLADPALRAAMGAAGRGRAEALFDVRVLGERLRTIWQAVLRERG